MALSSPGPSSVPDIETLIQLLQWRAAHQGNATAFVFLQDGEAEAIQLTYGQLDTWARAIAAQLQSSGMSGQRVLLFFPSSLEYLAAFFGCLYAGAVAVPVYPPNPARLSRALSRIQTIAHDAQPQLALTQKALEPAIRQVFSQSDGSQTIRCQSVGQIDRRLADAWLAP